MKYGEYARTRNGIIFQVDEEKKNIHMNEFMNMRGDRDIVNHSKAPKDLIQAGDLVYYTIKGLEHSTYLDIVAEHRDTRTLEKTLIVRMYKLEQLNIKKILTKEQINENIFEVVE